MYSKKTSFLIIYKTIHLLNYRISMGKTSDTGIILIKLIQRTVLEKI